MRLTDFARRLALVLVLCAPAAATAQQCATRTDISPPAGGWSAPLGTSVSLHVHDTSLRESLDHLSAQAKVSLAYSADFVPVDRRVCLSVDNEPLGAVLATLLRGTRVQVLVVAGRVVLSPGAATTLDAESTARAVNVLERVVVTGSAVPAARRALTIGLEVIDGEQLRRQAIGSLADLLDAAVPGVWSWAQSPSTLIGQYGSIRGASSFGSSSPKIYIDGVEVANPLVVTQMNPDVIDRVEVIRGPQGSALYGSDAISGVINILTRHDGGAVSAPAVSIRSVAGAGGSDYVSNLVPTHEQRVNVRLGSNLKSAGLAVTYGQTGALYPSADTRTVAITGDGRLVGTTTTLTTSARYFERSAGIGRNPLLQALISGQPFPQQTQFGSVTPAPTSADQKQSVRQYTVSGSASRVSSEVWTHTLLAGIDGYALRNVADADGPFPSQIDSALRAARGSGDRVTLRGTSVAHIGTEGDAEGTLTFGIEQSILRQLTTTTSSAAPQLGERYYTAVDRLVETWNHDTGLLSQLNMAWQNSIFLTSGLRVERNDSFSGGDRYPLLPMVGFAAVRGLGDADIKWRVAYGKGIRPPQTPARSSSSGYTGTLNNSGNGSVIAALNPEVQAGYETGAELYLGRAFTLQLTRFDQRATGLIQNVAIGVDTFARGATFERRVRYQLENVGEISNTGWELQGNVAIGGVTIASGLSSVDSRVQELAPGYAGDLRRGDRMLAVPARTGSLTVSWLTGPWFASIGATRASDWINYDRLALAKAYVNTSGTMPPKDFTGANLRSYWINYTGDTHVRVSASRAIMRDITLLVVGDNLLGGQLGEPDNVTIRQGRTITGGLRASF